MSKHVTLLISGRPNGENLLDLEIEPGTSVSDVLNAANLRGYLLSREGSAQKFAAEEQLYDLLADGEKLRAVPLAEVGSGIVLKILTALGLATPVEPCRKKSKSVEGQSRVRRSSVAVGRKGIRKVQRDRSPLHEIRQWRRQGDHLVGAYRTPRGSFCGEITVGKSQLPEFFIHSPPTALLDGPHRACFRDRGNGRYFVHMSRQVGADIDSGIVAIEHLIVDAIGSSKGAPR